MSRDCVLTHSPPAAPRRYFHLTHAITTGVALGLQVAALYAAVATFGVAGAVAFYGVGGLTALLNYGTRRRIS